MEPTRSRPRPVIQVAEPRGQVRSRLWASGLEPSAALASWLLIEATLDSFGAKGTARPFMGVDVS